MNTYEELVKRQMQSIGMGSVYGQGLQGYSANNDSLENLNKDLEKKQNKRKLLLIEGE